MVLRFLIFMHQVRKVSCFTLATLLVKMDVENGSIFR